MNLRDELIDFMNYLHEIQSMSKNVEFDVDCYLAHKSIDLSHTLNESQTISDNECKSSVCEFSRDYSHCGIFEVLQDCTECDHLKQT